MNIPMKSGSGWTEYEQVLREKALPWLKEFDADLVLVSAGYDALSVDPLAGQQLTSSDYGAMSKMVRQVLGDKIVLGLEGGYSLDTMGLPEAVAQTIAAFVEDVPEPNIENVCIDD